MQRPNFLVVIYDALRASDFPGGESPVDGMPVTARLLQESIRFPRASSVAPWTIPAHASVFTGLYPWENGCHAKNDLKLAADVPRLPGALSAAGYRTLLLSANTLVCPRFGLAEGFNDAGWGGWWESYIRQARRDVPPSTLDASRAEAEVLGRFRDGPLGKIFINSTEAAYRYPFMFDALDLFHQRIRRTTARRDPSMSPWIEPVLERWVRSQPADAPIFCAINNCDTHEPYYVPDELSHNFSSWWSLARVRQDFVRCISGKWKPSTEELRALRTLYRYMVQHTDQRLGRMIEVLKETGRWENTVLIVTSDHGQAFGEHGELFHLNGVVDSMLRIPMIYRPVGGVKGGRVGKGWASLVDIAPTVLRDAGVTGLSTPSAYPLQYLADLERPTPCFAASDGLVWNHLKRVVPAERKAEFDRVRVVAYSGDVKLVRDFTSQKTAAFNLRKDPAEDLDIWPQSSGELFDLERSADEIGERMTRGAPAPISAEIEERLRSWGYV
jgi:arylsulfatase A-like enzyme